MFKFQIAETEDHKLALSSAEGTAIKQKDLDIWKLYQATIFNRKNACYFPPVMVLSPNMDDAIAQAACYHDYEGRYDGKEGLAGSYAQRVPLIIRGWGSDEF